MTDPDDSRRRRHDPDREAWWNTFWAIIIVSAFFGVFIWFALSTKSP